MTKHHGGNKSGSGVIANTGWPNKKPLQKHQ